MGWLETAAFTLLIGAQFLAAIFLITRRQTVYADPRQTTGPQNALPATHREPAEPVTH